MNRIEILSVSSLDTLRPLVEGMRNISEKLSIGLGWHYLLDLPWAAREVVLRPGMRVMDAGAGWGVMQWWLAERGVTVISVDRRTRANPPHGVQKYYRILGLRREDLSQASPWVSVRGFLPPRSPRRWKTYPAKLGATLDGLFAHKKQDGLGTVYIYNEDLKDMAEIASDSVDAIVSISALEHNPPDDLKACMTELMRVLKPGGGLVATLAAARDNDWYHEPSNGWCYTESTLRDIFDLPPECPSNYDRYDELFEGIRNCDELRENLADFYFKSGDNGMPWGTWDPEYQPVGVVKAKPLV